MRQQRIQQIINQDQSSNQDHQTSNQDHQTSNWNHQTSNQDHQARLLRLLPWWLL